MPLVVLVADDDFSTRISIRDYLQHLGYTAIIAENGKMALKALERFQPHLVITDVKMPSMDGYELVRQIRQEPSLRLLPVIFLTARDAVQERVKGYQLGCDVYLAKPFELEELGAIVRNLLERSQMIQAEYRYRQPQSTNEASSSQVESVSLTATHDSGDERLNVTLTAREKDVLKHLSHGYSNAKIGEQLHLSPRTIEKYVSRLLQKTGTSNRADLVRFAIEQHLIV